MTLSKQSHTFVPVKNGTGFDEFMSLRERFVTTKFAVSLSAPMVRELLDYTDRDESNLAAISTQLAKWISQNELKRRCLHGTAHDEHTAQEHDDLCSRPAVYGIPSCIPPLLFWLQQSIQDALKRLGEPKPALIFSGYAPHDQYAQKIMLDRSKDYLRIVDIFVIETHYHEEEQFCRLVYPSIFVRVRRHTQQHSCGKSRAHKDKVKHRKRRTVKSALLWMEMVKEDDSLNGTHNICFSLDMSTMSFDVAANSRPSVGGWCTGRKWLNYGQVSDNCRCSSMHAAN
ncbi:hypothetical protein MRX96_011545 [Rhipicephalus microplus]